MEKYVYLLRDGNGKVVDVGEAKNPPTRLYRKTKVKPRPSDKTSFYGRTDITQEIVAGPMPKKEARAMEGRLKLHYGLEHTEAISRKLTMEDAREVRRLYATGEFTQRELSVLFGIKHTAIGKIIRNTTYIE